MNNREEKSKGFATQDADKLSTHVNAVANTDHKTEIYALDFKKIEAGLSDKIRKLLVRYNNKKSTYEKQKLSGSPSAITALGELEKLKSQLLYEASELSQLGEVEGGKNGQRGIQYTEKALFIQTKVHKGLDITIANSYNNIGCIFYDMHQYKNAQHFFEYSLKIKKSIHKNMPNQSIIEALHNLGNVWRRQFQHDKAIYYYDLAFTMMKKIKLEKTFFEYADDLVHIFIEDGNYKHAMYYAEQALAIESKMYDHISPRNIAVLLDRLAKIFSKQDEGEKAQECYQRALAIFGNVHCTQPSDDVATVLHNMAIFFNEQHKHKKAKRYAEQSLAMRKQIHQDRPNYDSANTLDLLGGICGILCDNEVAQIYLEKALNMRKEIANDKPTKVIAASLFNLGSFFIKLGQLRKALEYFHQALTCYEHNLGKFHYDIRDTRIALARTYLELAKIKEQDEKERFSHLQQVQTFYEKVLNIDDEILQHSDHQFSIYDLLQHHNLLTNLAQLYCLQNQPLKAAQLYTRKAEAFQNQLPILALKYTQFALHNYRYCSEQGHTCAKLYALRAKIAHQALRYRFAIRNMEKAVALDEKQEVWQNQLAAWHQQQQQRLTELDEDLYALLENCFDTYHEIQLQYIEDIGENSELSEYVKNRTTELIIKIRNILDIAYGRFARWIHRKNGIKKSGDLYYPIEGAEKALEMTLKEHQLIQTGVRIKKENLEKALLADLESKYEKIKLDRELKTEVQQLGYLDKNDQITEKYQKEKKDLEVIGVPADRLTRLERCLAPLLLKENIILITEYDKQILLNLDERFNLYRELLINLFEHQKPGTIIEKRIWGEQVIQNSRPPEWSVVANHLCKQRYLQKEQLSGTALAEYYLTAEFKGSLPVMPELKGYHGRVGHMLKDCKISFDQQTSLNTTFPALYERMVQEQTFFYYRDKNNDADQGSWRRAWLEKIDAIANDSKHVRLTPQSFKNVIMDESQGTFKKQVSVINIHYLEPSFYSWSFFDCLTSQPNDLLRIQLSREILHILIEKGYIKTIYLGTRHYQIVVHPIANAILKAVQKKDATTEEYLTEKFRAEVKKDLPKAGADYWRITNLLISHTLQRGHARLVPDQLVDVNQLLQKALYATSELVYAFGKAAGPLTSAPIINVSHSKLPRIRHQALVDIKSEVMTLEKKHDDLHKYLSVKLNIPLIDSWQYHEILTLLSRQHGLLGNRQYAGEIYQKAGELLEKHYPALAIRYYQKALLILQDVLSAQTIYCVPLYVKLADMLYPICPTKALGYLHKALLIEKTLALHKKYNTYDKDHQNQLKIIDNDLYSQWEHANWQATRLEYLCFKLAGQPENRQRLHEVQNKFAELIIKLRHLLDQALGRLVKTGIFLPNKHEEKDVHYPCAGSKKRFEDLLRKANIVTDEKRAKVCLSRLYPKTYVCMEQTQPYYFYNIFNEQKDPTLWQRSWLDKIVMLSNEIKHIRLAFPSPDTLIKRRDQGVTLQNFYLMGYRENMIYDWSFTPELTKLAESTRLVEGLKVTNYIDKEGGKGRPVILDKEIITLAKSQRENSADFPREFKHQCERLQKRIVCLKTVPASVVEQIMNKLLRHAGNDTNENINLEWCEALPLLKHSLTGVGQVMHTIFYEQHEIKKRAKFSWYQTAMTVALFRANRDTVPNHLIKNAVVAMIQQSISYLPFK